MTDKRELPRDTRKWSSEEVTGNLAYDLQSIRRAGGLTIGRGDNIRRIEYLEALVSAEFLQKFVSSGFITYSLPEEIVR